MNIRTPITILMLGAMTSATAGNSMQFEASTGPVIVTWGQPAELAKATEYAVQIEDLDANGDGRLRRSEIPADHALQYEFKLVDRNRDGYVSTAELKAWK